MNNTDFESLEDYLKKNAQYYLDEDLKHVTISPFWRVGKLIATIIKRVKLIHRAYGK